MLVHTKRNHYIVTHLPILKTPNAQNVIGAIFSHVKGPFSHIRLANGLVIHKKSLDIGLNFCQKKEKKSLKKWVVFHETCRGGSQIRFDVENPDRIGSQFAKIMKNIWIAPPRTLCGNILFVCLFVFFLFCFVFISLVGKEVKKDETYMAKNTGDGWETMITYPIFYYSHTTLNGDLSMFFFRCNCC